MIGTIDIFLRFHWGFSSTASSLYLWIFSCHVFPKFLLQGIAKSVKMLSSCVVFFAAYVSRCEWFCQSTSSHLDILDNRFRIIDKVFDIRCYYRLNFFRIERFLQHHRVSSSKRFVQVLCWAQEEIPNIFYKHLHGY